MRLPMRLFGLRTLAVCVTLAPVFGRAPALAQVAVQPSAREQELRSALAVRGLRVTDVRILNGDPQQFGTYAGFSLLPVTIPDGIVLSTGLVSSVIPTADTQVPDYDPSWPPEYLRADLQSGTTTEFTDYGTQTGAIFNFYSVNDVASVEITFELDEPGNVKFDFVFGSVEFPYWTSAYTDAFVAFVDGVTPTDQVSFDPNGAAIQVGQSFASLVTLNDSNTAFSSPHGLIRKLTTTTPVLEDGEHTIRFEVGDVNDGILDSAVFIANLRAEAGDPGTDQSPPDDCVADFDRDGSVTGADLAMLLMNWGPGHAYDIDEDDWIGGSDLSMVLLEWGECPAQR